MMRLLIRCIIAIPLLLTLTLIATADINLPKPQGLVNDFARKLSQGTKKSLETNLRNFRAHSDIEFTVVIIPFAELQGYAIEEYALQMGRRWGVGRGSEKLGLLLVVAIKPPDGKGIYQGLTRLEVSRHLEGDMPDGLANELIRKMRDDLKAGKFDQAITTGTNSIISALTSRRNLSNSSPPRSYPLTRSAPPPRDQDSSSDWSVSIPLFPVVLVLFAIILTFMRLRGRLNGGILDTRGRRSAYDNQGDFYNHTHVNNHTDSTGFFGGSNDFGSSSNSGGSSDFGSSSDFGGGSSSGSDFGSSSDSGGGSDFGGGGDYGGGGSTDSW